MNRSLVVCKAWSELSQTCIRNEVRLLLKAALGICLPSLRDDSRVYAGDDAVLYGSLEELRAVLTGLLDAEALKRGAELACRCDGVQNTSSLVALNSATA